MFRFKFSQIAVEKTPLRFPLPDFCVRQEYTRVVYVNAQSTNYKKLKVCNANFFTKLKTKSVIVAAQIKVNEKWGNDNNREEKK